MASFFGRNKKRLQSFSMLLHMVLLDVIKLEKEIEDIKNEIKETQLKLEKVSDK